MVLASECLHVFALSVAQMFGRSDENQCKYDGFGSLNDIEANSCFGQLKTSMAGRIQLIHCFLGYLEPPLISQSMVHLYVALIAGCHKARVSPELERKRKAAYRRPESQGAPS